MLTTWRFYVLNYLLFNSHQQTMAYRVIIFYNCFVFANIGRHCSDIYSKESTHLNKRLDPLSRQRRLKKLKLKINWTQLRKNSINMLIKLICQKTNRIRHKVWNFIIKKWKRWSWRFVAKIRIQIELKGNCKLGERRNKVV
jgi:uncharacterized membrane protein